MDIFPNWRLEYDSIRQSDFPDINDLTDVKDFPQDLRDLLEKQHGFPSRFQRRSWHCDWFRLHPDPTHALVEVRTNRVWLVTNDAEGADILREVSKTLYSKIYTVVIDLDGPRSCLDNACCMDWYTDRSGLWYNILDGVEVFVNPGQIQKLDCDLVCRASTVSGYDDDLQAQMMFLYAIFLQLARNPVWVGAEMSKQSTQLHQEVMEDIKKLFQVELYIDQITRGFLDLLQDTMCHRPRWSYAVTLFPLLPRGMLIDEI